MGFPKSGLYYEDGRRRLLKYKTAIQNPNMRDALIDDVRIHEGDAAANELSTEFTRKRLMNDRIKKSRLTKYAGDDDFLQGQCDPNGLRK